MRFLTIMICSVLLGLGGTAASASSVAPAQDGARKTIVGKVFLDEESSVPGDYVMIYFPSLGTGTMSDEFGDFSITLPQQPATRLTIEYSRIGYETITKEIYLRGDLTELETVNMKPQTLMLTAAYVTPDGMDPGDYVLSKVWEKTKEVRKKKLTYGADITYEFATHEIPLVAEALPKGKVGLVKVAGALVGYGSLLNYVLKNDDISASASLSRTVSKGKTNDYNQKITASDPDPLPKAVQKDIIKFFGEIDLFELVYGETNDWGQKFSKRHKFKLVGTYEYGDKLVDVLSWTGREKITVNLHVVQDEWGILKLQCQSQEGEVMRGECRDRGNGVYMPISFILKPTITKIRNEDLPALLEFAEESKDLNKASKARIRKILQERIDNGEDFNPYVTCGFNVRYR